MVRVLVTVGTTNFDRLIEQVMSTISQSMNVTYQVSNSSSYVGASPNVLGYSEEFETLVNDSDVIITHAGAGSIYDFLEKGKKIIVVPNFERHDKHQKELANYVERNNYGLIGCAYTSNFEELIQAAISKVFSPYLKVDFFFTDTLYEMLD